MREGERRLTSQVVCMRLDARGGQNQNSRYWPSLTQGILDGLVDSEFIEFMEHLLNDEVLESILREHDQGDLYNPFLNEDG